MGDEVTLLDGVGGLYSARVESIGADEAHLEVIEVSNAGAPPQVDLALPAIKAQRLDLAVEKCTEIGFNELLLFSSRRSVWRGGEREVERKRERLERKIISACKQSGQPFFPRIGAVTGLEGLLESIPRYGRVYLADSRGEAVGESDGPSKGRKVLAIVGPEGGFDEGERAGLVAAGAIPVSLGRSRLRSETAAIILLFAVRSRIEQEIDSGARR